MTPTTLPLYDLQPHLTRVHSGTKSIPDFYNRTTMMWSIYHRNHNWFSEQFAGCVYLVLHVFIFETSICYLQDNPRSLRRHRAPTASYVDEWATQARGTVRPTTALGQPAGALWWRITYSNRSVWSQSVDNQSQNLSRFEEHELGIRKRHHMCPCWALLSTDNKYRGCSLS